MARPSQRQHFLDAAASLVGDEGAGELTFDRLAQLTGASKGGLLYHFPTKRDLVAALLEHTFDRFEALMDARTADDPRRFAWAHAYVDATFDLTISRPELLAASLIDPEDGHEVLRACGERIAGWQQRMVREGLPEGLAAAVRYACDGWWTLSALEVGPVVGDAEGLAATLHELLDQAAKGREVAVGSQQHHDGSAPGPATRPQRDGDGTR
ncbi:MAG: TetR/AcrR family transcriptional regulator [Nitriliruptoraceae bacterium]